MAENLYFIAVVPPAPLAREIRNLQEQFKRHYGAAHALRSPPHVTLQAPFKKQEAEEDAMCRSLASFAKPEKTFAITLNGFGRFGERVIFIDVVPNGPLQELQARLAAWGRAGMVAPAPNRPFRHHLTVAHRDLKPEQFKKAWEEYGTRTFEGQFEATAITLLRLRAAGWETIKSFPFR